MCPPRTLQDGIGAGPLATIDLELFAEGSARGQVPLDRRSRAVAAELERTRTATTRVGPYFARTGTHASPVPNRQRCRLGYAPAFFAGVIQERRVGLRAVRATPRGGEADSEAWYAALCLAGEARLRVGEIKALRWREDVDLTIPCSGESGPREPSLSTYARQLG